MSGTSGRTCPACKKPATREAMICTRCGGDLFDRQLWAAGWRVVLDRPAIPVSWPAEFGPPREGQVCAACGGASWHILRDGIGCSTCHPPVKAARPVEVIRTGQQGPAKIEGDAA